MRPGRGADDLETVGDGRAAGDDRRRQGSDRGAGADAVAVHAAHGEELWEHLGHRGGVVDAGWPAFDEAVARADEIVVPVQVNGKVRARAHGRGRALPTRR